MAASPTMRVHDGSLPRGDGESISKGAETRGAGGASDRVGRERGGTDAAPRLGAELGNTALSDYCKPMRWCVGDTSANTSGLACTRVPGVET